MTTTHSSSQRLSTQLNTAQHQQHTACQPTCPTGLVTTAHRTRLDPVCARDSFGASPCFRGRAGIWRGSPCCLPRAVFTCIHICISHKRPVIGDIDRHMLISFKSSLRAAACVWRGLCLSSERCGVWRGLCLSSELRAAVLSCAESRCVLCLSSERCGVWRGLCLSSELRAAVLRAAACAESRCVLCLSSECCGPVC